MPEAIYGSANIDAGNNNYVSTTAPNPIVYAGFDVNDGDNYASVSNVESIQYERLAPSTVPNGNYAAVTDIRPPSIVYDQMIGVALPNDDSDEYKPTSSGSMPAAVTNQTFFAVADKN